MFRGRDTMVLLTLMLAASGLGLLWGAHLGRSSAGAACTHGPVDLLASGGCR